MSEGFPSYPWKVRYTTSKKKKSGEATDVLHEFYIPALERAVRYDRMAGYFRSSSLAAASQGYTAFLRHNGKMRMIVGADLLKQDVEAIIAGNNQRLEELLLNELDKTEDWPEDVKNGVSLLGRMVASGQLTVKVAFRIKADTGEPTDFSFEEDGYVHEKWFIMYDAEENRIYGGGSLNESVTALKHNAENIDIHCDWKNDENVQRTDEAVENFEDLWKNDVEYMRVLPIPTAVKNRLVHLKDLRDRPAEIDGSVFREKKSLSPEDVLRFVVLKDAPLMPNGRFVGMYSAPVAPWPHQEIVSRKLVESYPYSYLLCDEVGLGKTIEAALALRSLMLSGRIERALIVAPASLTDQWQRELADKALLPFEKTKSKLGYTGKISHTKIYPENHETVDDALYSSPFNIISSGLLASKAKIDQLKNCKYDVVLLDEAHYARRQNPRDGAKNSPRYTKLYQCLQSDVKNGCKSLWLATATPMQIDQVEVTDLYSLTDRVGSFKYDPTIALNYFWILEILTGNNKIGAAAWRFFGRIYQQMKALDFYYWQNLQKTLIDTINQSSLEKMIKRAPVKDDIKNMLRVLFALSPLSRVMMRHNRSLLEIYRDKGKLNSNLAVREVLPICAVQFTKKEKKLYEMLSKYCKDLREQIKKHAGISPQMLQFLLMSMQLRFSSSLYAIKLTMTRRLENVKKALSYKLNTEKQGTLFIWDGDAIDDSYYDFDDAEEDVEEEAVLKSMLERSVKDLKWERKQLEAMLSVLEENTETPSKMQRLLEEIEKRREGKRFRQTVIFTKYFDTLENIRYYLRRSQDMRVGIYSGKKTSYYNVKEHKDVNITRDEVKKLFLNGDIDILLCTDAAAEGLNLQTADMLINFDLGWNPMKLEQRIGRIDRIGQKYEKIFVLNMCYQGSVEEKVYDRLWQRLKDAFSAIGTQQVSMLPVTAEDFQKLQDGEITFDELTKKSREILNNKQKAARSMEFTPKEQYDIYQKISEGMKKQQYPATLKDIDDAFASSSYFSEIGAEKQANGFWHFPKCDSLPEYRGTVEQGPAVSHEEFLSWGNPYLEKVFCLMDNALDELPFIHRIELNEKGTTFVGYVVKKKTGRALVSTYRQAVDFTDMDYEGYISEDDIRFGMDELRKQIKPELDEAQRIGRAKESNEQFALLHKRLIKRVAAEILLDEFSNGENDAAEVIRKLEEGIWKMRKIRLPSREFKNQEVKLLFDVLEEGDELYATGTYLLISSVIDYLERSLNGMKKSSKEITVDRLLKSINDSIAFDKKHRLSP